MLTEGKGKRFDSEQGRDPRKTDRHYVTVLEAASTSHPGSDYVAGTDDEANNTDTNLIKEKEANNENEANNTDKNLIKENVRLRDDGTLRRV